MVFNSLLRALKDRYPRRVKTPTVLQMEAVECGAAALGILLAYYRRIVPLAELRQACGVSRDGSKASNILQAARNYGLEAKGYKKSLSAVRSLPGPFIVFWDFNHFLVVEGFGRLRVYLNDPATGPRTVSWDEFDRAYTGIVLVVKPGPTFRRGGRKPSLMQGLWQRLQEAFGALLYCILAGFLLVIPGILLPVFSQIFIDRILIEGRWHWLRPLLLGMGGTILVQGSLYLLQLRYLRRLRIKLAVGMSGRFLWHLLHLPVGFYAQRFAGEISARMRLNDKVAEGLSGQLAQTVIDGVMTIFYAAVMVAYDWQLTSIGVGFAIANVAVLQWVSRRRVDANLRLAQDAGKVAGVEIAALQSIETIKSSASEADFFTRWSGYYAQYINAQQALNVPNQLISALPTILTALTTLLILVLGGLQVINGNLTIGMLVAFQSLMGSFQKPINRLMGFGGLLQELEGDLTRLDDVLKNPIDPAIESANPLSSEEEALPRPLQGCLEFRQVTFGYSPVEPPSIENLSFKLEPGQRLALVGRSGSGKSTIAKLACGLYQPWSGEILIDGQRLQDIPRPLLAQTLAMVEQDIFLFGGTVRDNLTLWDPTVPDSHLMRASQDAVIDEVIRALPGGYGGALLEGGANLSGGQRQRLEIARALVHEPAILVLDEATSALDTETERQVDRHLRRRGCSCLLIAHRLSTIRDCDRILVLEDGQVVQQGTHDRLWQQDGPYARLIRSEGEAISAAAPPSSVPTRAHISQSSSLGKAPRSWDSRLVSAVVDLGGNQPLLLDDPERFWLIQSGSMAVFAIPQADGMQGKRQHLLTVVATQGLFGFPTMPTQRAWQLVAIALEPTQLQERSLSELAAAISVHHPVALALLDTWSQQLQAVLARVDAPSVTVEGPSNLSWAEQLKQRHIQVLAALDDLERQANRSAWERLQAREAVNRQATQTALNQLATAFRSHGIEEEIPVGSDELLVAMGAVGHALGVKVQPPPATSADPRDPLAEIARASRLQMRRVQLVRRWWRQDCGPLLAYTKAERRPVALLSEQGDCYCIFDPVARTRTPVNHRTARCLAAEAVTFYRPLPQPTHSALTLLQFALQGKGRILLTIALTGAVATGLGMLTPLTTGLLIDRAIPHADRGLLLQIGLGLGAAALGTTLFQLTQSFATLRLEAQADAATQAGLWDRLLNLQVAFFRQYATGDLQMRVTAVQQMRRILSGVTLQTLFASFFSLLNLVLLFCYSARLAGVALAIALVAVFVTTISGLASRRYLRPLQDLKGILLGSTVQLIGGVAKLRVAAAEQRAFAHWASEYGRQLQLTLKTQTIEDLAATFNLLLPTVSSLFLFWVAVGLMDPATGNSRLSTGTFLAFNVAFTTFISGATALSGTLLNTVEIGVLWERVLPILKATPEVRQYQACPGKLKGQLAIERVSFRYGEGGPLALNGVSLRAEPGEFVALVGPSGSGKSTLLRLLLGFETPESGAVFYDGQNIAGLDMAAVRRQLGVVIQDGRINTASIFENISGGSLVTMADAEAAAQMAGFADDIAAMPMGMHTIISEGGSNLSGGQRQRLLVARALARKPRVLLFDEATSALDNRTQEIVTRSLDKLRVTRLVIAHRLSTIRNADRIYVMQEGRAIQQGTFESLAAEKGLFSQSIARQLV